MCKLHIPFLLPQHARNIRTFELIFSNALYGYSFFENGRIVILRKLQSCYSLYYVAIRVRCYQVYFTKYSNSFGTGNLHLIKMETMKNLIFALFLTVFAINAYAQTTPKKAAAAKVITKQTVDIACGECQF